MKKTFRSISHALVLVPFLVPVRDRSQRSLSLAPVLIHILAHCMAHVLVHVLVVLQEPGPFLALESRLDSPGGKRTESLK